MKRKKTAAMPAVEPVQAAPAAAPIRERLDLVWAVLFSMLLFLSMTIQTGRVSLILLVLALALSIGRGPLRNLRERFSVPVLGFVLFAFMQGFAAIYSHFGDYAVREYQKFLASFSLAVILLVRIDKKNVRGVLWGMAAVSAALSFLCVDMACDGAVFHGFNSCAELLGATFSNVELTNLGSRVPGLYNDANVSGSILALGSLVALYLAESSRVLWKKALACFLLGVSAMGFFLSMSRGAILCFGLALLVWLIAAGKGNRLPLFFLMFFSALTVVGLSIPAMSAISGGGPLPDLLVLAAGPVIFGLDWALGSRLARVLEGHGKAITVTAVVLAALCVGYAVAAMTVTGPYTFEGNEVLTRSVELAPGTYTISADCDSSLVVNVYTQSEMDMLRGLGTGSTLYHGPMEDASFTVTGEEYRLAVWFEGQPGVTLRQVVFSDGTEVALARPLLPSFLANRLQDDLLTSSSFVQRVQFLKDGWKLFLKSPLLGHGLGGTEGMLTAVQSYYYESKYIHNYVLQVLDDMGLLGAAAFLAFLAGGLWLLLRRLRAERDGLAAMLLACWLMINLHSLMEINFSIRAYQCFAYPLLLLPAVLYAKPLSQKAAKVGGIVTACLLWVYMAVFGGLYISHRIAEKDMEEGIRTSDAGEFMEFCESLVSRDVFDHEQNQLTYVANAVALNDSRYNRKLRLYVEELRASGTYTACSGLERYYYLPKGELEELFACSREGIAQEASNKDAWNLQFDFYRTELLSALADGQEEAYLNGVLGTKAYLDEYDRDRLEPIELTEENQSFLSLAASARESGMPASDICTMLRLQSAETPAS